MKNNNTIKCLDILIKNIDNTENFDIEIILSNSIKLDNNEVIFNVFSFGEKHNLFEKAVKGDKGTSMKLTPKGERLKEFKKGFVKFENKSTNTPLTLYQKIYLPILIFSVLFSVVLGLLNYLSNKKIDSLTEKYNLLESEFGHYKDSVNKLNKKIDIKKVTSLNDTLQTKNFGDLKLD